MNGVATGHTPTSRVAVVTGQTIGVNGGYYM
jgi:hypothetical protein